MEVVAARRPRMVGRKCIVGMLVVDVVRMRLRLSFRLVIY